MSMALSLFILQTRSAVLLSAASVSVIVLLTRFGVFARALLALRSDRIALRAIVVCLAPHEFTTQGTMSWVPTNNPHMEILGQAQEALPVSLRQLGHMDACPAGHNLRNILRAHLLCQHWILGQL